MPKRKVKMKIPKTMHKFCPKCKTYTEMTVAQSKVRGKNKTHTMSRGSRTRMRMRGKDRGYGNKGSISRGAISSWKLYGAKSSKKLCLTLKCKKCGKSRIFAGSRTKRVEISTV